MKYRVGISGSYGGMNLGDEAILEVILKELRACLDTDIVVFSRSPKDTEKRHKVRAVPIRELHKDEVLEELRQLDLLVLGGGGILFDGMVERFDAHVLFVPMELGENKDLQHSHAVISKMANAKRASVLKGEYTSAQVLGLIRHMAFAVGMRLHFLMFAGIQHVPFVPLPYASKVTGFLADLEMPMTPIEGLNVGKLCAFLDRSWDNRKTMQKKLEDKTPPLQERAKRTNQILCELLRSLPSKGG